MKLYSKHARKRHPVVSDLTNHFYDIIHNWLLIILDPSYNRNGVNKKIKADGLSSDKYGKGITPILFDSLRVIHKCSSCLILSHIYFIEWEGVHVWCTTFLFRIIVVFNALLMCYTFVIRSFVCSYIRTLVLSFGLFNICYSLQ